MRAPPSRLEDWRNSGCNEIVDVRSPAEYALDHIPGAVNLPLLDNCQRAEVGTLYRQNPRAARLHGGGLALVNIARHLEQGLAARGSSWRPLLYCWRGGQRSEAFALTLRQLGWDAQVLAGGYRAYRRQVVRELSELPEKIRLLVVAGRTGNGKSAILRKLAEKGQQVLDLEDMAQHRGSLLGSIPDRPQPSQKAFETLVHAQLSALDSRRPVFIESESNRIGNLYIPPALWRRLRSAGEIRISSPAMARAAFLCREYRHLTNSPTLAAALDTLAARRGWAIARHWQRLAAEGSWLQLAESLLSEHYDPSYDKSLESSGRNSLFTIELSAVDDDQIDRAVQSIEQRFNSASAQLPTTSMPGTAGDSFPPTERSLSHET